MQSVVLARRNGEGDVSSISGSVLQSLWNPVLALATDAGM
jgi:hypothetical protein